MKVVIFGATGGTGRAVVAHALAAGHEVTTLVRNGAKLPPLNGLRVLQGDAMVQSDVAAAIQGQEAVVISLGNSQNAFALMLGAKRTTPRDICEVGTRNILSCLAADGALPLIVLSAFGVGETRAQAPFVFKLFFRLVLREQMADKEKQDAALKASRANWVIVQPIALTDKPATGRCRVAADGIYGRAEVSRADLAAHITSLLTAGHKGNATMTFSG